MAKKLAKLLMADINATSDLAEIAKMLQSKGRGNDTILAHITKREAERLKRDGGSGTINPETGLLEFDDYAGFAPTATDYGAFGEPPAVVTQTQDVRTDLPPVTNVQAGQSEAPVPLYDSRGNALDSGIDPLSRESLANIRYQAVKAQDGELPSAAAGSSQSGFYGLDAGQASYGLQRPSAADYGVQIPASARTVPEYPAAPRLGYGVTDTAVQPTLASDQAAPTTKPWYDKISTADMLRLGLAGGLGLYGASQTKKAAEQQQQAMEEQKNLAAPYQAQGKELVRAAQAGELTPAAAQSYQALQARLAQGAESRGGVGAAQSAAQAEAYRQQLLQGQYDYGLKVSNIGDNIAIGAIRTGMQADQQLNQANSSFYTNLAMIGAGIPMYTSRG